MPRRGRPYVVECILASNVGCNLCVWIDTLYVKGGDQSWQAVASEKMLDASAPMDYGDEIDLSQQLSQVCLQSPLLLSHSEEESADKFDVGTVNLADPENPSLDFLCTPDFITPVEQQFSTNLDNKENSTGLRSPRALTPVRNKRLKHDTVHTKPSWRDENMRRQSPVSIQNPFLLEDTNLPQKMITSAKITEDEWEQTFISIYRHDFHEIREIGHGNFSRVFKVLKRIDGCMYAIKRSRHSLRSTVERRQALTEVQALAAVGFHENVVRYYTAWFEDEYCYIQTELCESNLTQLRDADPNVSKETSLLEIMRQMASALSAIHSKGLVHLDVKPDNIYVLNGVYKLGDFGRAVRADGSMEIEEGDARYMPLEILNDDHSQLTKVDMFSLGATIYELARGLPLPTSGAQFQSLREGKLSLLPGYSLTLQNIFKALLNPDASARPSAAELLNHSVFHRGLARVSSLDALEVTEKSL
ncbi:wee1-like protein kinase isoform X1 [Physcomitrium patens]|uniref:wee1-like protein kinase isoform X1 n=1 Tax=Physcomitrium patens TaxID=3218 RepID=UPI003CCE4ECB